MKKTVEFEVLKVNSCDAFIANKYPDNGLFLITDEHGNSGFIQVIDNMVFGSFMSVGFYPETKDVEVKKESTPDDSISGDMLLKVLAVSQDPKLAKDLIK